MHKAGFVNIIGSPNVGKSTLMNLMVGEKLSIITSKAQTTRHRILGIVNEEDYQIVFSDTPGVVRPSYKLHESMMGFVNLALRDADLILLLIELGEKSLNNPEVLERLKTTSSPILLLINKVDLGDQEKMNAAIDHWHQELPKAEILPISALHNFNVDLVWDKIKSSLPESPPYFPKDELTDRPMRFFISEIIREKILLNYQKEIPYCSEVVVEDYKDFPEIVKIRANIIVARESQKAIIIGKAGEMLKRVGTDSRKDMEVFIGKKVYLELYVKVDKDWRDKDDKLKKYGYTQ